MKRRWKVLLGTGGLLLVAALTPIIYIESSCTAPLPGLDSAAAFKSRLPDQTGRRTEARTWLTYPEWYIVYSAESYGRYLATGNRPSGFGHWQEIRGFWSGLCAVNRASAPAGGAGDAKVMLYTIGLSFSAEMTIKAFYENTLGRVAEWIGGWQSPNDRYNAGLWRRYGAFMHQTPWYAFPFGEAVGGLWGTSAQGHGFRHWERRLALSVEYGAKAGYAALIGWASGATLGRDELTLRFVARADPGALARIDPRLRPVASLGGGLVVVEAPRYEVFTQLMRRLARTPVQLTEIAGNDDVFVTLLVPEGARLPDGTFSLMEVPLRDRPGWGRVGVNVKVAQLLPLIRQAEAGRIAVEHVYDY